MQVYLITNTVNEKVYVGQTKKSLRSRFRGHVYESEIGRSKCAIHRAIRKHGKDVFAIDLIQKCSTQDELNAMEAFWIKRYNAVGKGGYNLNCGEGVSGVSEETRRKMSECKRGKKHSTETREKISRAKIGVPLGPHSEETKAKISAGNKGKVRSPEVCRKLSERKRLPPSDETRRKMADASRGRVASKETREKLALANTGKKHSAETRAKLSMAHAGTTRKPLSEETKARISAANSGRKRGPEALKNIAEGKLRAQIAKMTPTKVDENEEPTAGGECALREIK